MGERGIGEKEGQRIEIPRVELDVQRPRTTNANKVTDKKWQKETICCFGAFRNWLDVFSIKEVGGP